MGGKTVRRELIIAAIKLAADAPLRYTRPSLRCTLKRTLVEELRRELDIAGFGDDWRTLQHIMRAEEKAGVEVSA